MCARDIGMKIRKKHCVVLAESCNKGRKATTEYFLYGCRYHTIHYRSIVVLHSQFSLLFGCCFFVIPSLCFCFCCFVGRGWKYEWLCWLQLVAIQS